MKKNILLFPVIILISVTGFSQKVSGKLSFQPGQTVNISVNVKSTLSQEAMGQGIDFTAEGTANHSYKVTNATDNNNTLHHQVDRITFQFDAMGTKSSFDSDNKKDMDGMFGPTMKEILSKTFDMIIDPSGKTLMTKPEKIELGKADERVAIVSGLLKDITGIIYPPQKNEASFFKILPDKETGINESWTEAGEGAGGKFSNTYTLTGITDSTILIDIKGNSVTKTKAEIMGAQANTTMNNSYTGKIILDKSTGIIRKKTIETTSNGSTEVMGSTLPVTSKATVTTTVTQVH